MEYRKLGRTGLKASVIGFGAEWIGKMEQAEVNAMAARGAAAGVNIVDCWMSDPAVRSALGEALEPTRRPSGWRSRRCSASTTRSRAPRWRASWWAWKPWNS